MRRLFIVLFCLISVTFSWGQKIKYKISNGLQLEGVDSKSPIIYDNDMVEDTPEDQLLWLKYHYGEVNLVGNIITRNMDKCNVGPCKYSMQHTIDQWNRVTSAAKKAGMKILDPVIGSSDMLPVPSSQKIEDTKWKGSAGVDLIIREAQKASKARPLVIIIGGQATTVANALLKNPSIADRMVVLHINGYRDAPKARGFNTIDAWSAYVVMSKVRYVNFTGDQYSWYKGKNVNLTKTMVNSLPNNHFSNDIKTWYNKFFHLESLADAPPVLYLFKPSLWKNVSRKLKNGQTTTGDNFDYLLVSDNDWTAYGPAFVELVKGAGSQKNNLTVAVSSVAVSSTSLQLKTGATSQLTKTISPSNATNQNVTWSSSNTAIATVSASGLVTAKAVGTAAITVKTADGAKTATTNVTVSSSNIAVSSVAVSSTSLQLKTGATSQLTKTISPSNATNQNVTWTSSNTAIATVSASGLVTAKAVGSAVITVKSADGGKVATTNVTITNSNIAVTSISISPATISVPVNGNHQFSAQVSPSNATTKEVKWSSSNTAIATVSSTGLVTAKAKGSATITSTTVDGNKTAKATVTVTEVQTSGEIIVDNAKRGTGLHQFNFAGSGWTHGANTSDPYHDKTVSFSNTANNTATVSFTGNKVELYSAKASHHGIIAISIDNGPEKMVDLYAASRQNYVLVFGSAELSQGNHTIKIRVTGNKNSAATGTYAILDYIKIHSGKAASSTSIRLSTEALTLGIDEKKQLTKVVTPASAENDNVSWSSSNNSVAVVNASGVITGVSSGTATITVKTSDNKTATAVVTVTAPSNGFDFDNADRGTGINKFNFTGNGWTHSVNASDPYLNKTVSFSNVTNDQVTVKFIGNKVELYSSKASHHGIIGVSIDNGPEKLVDLYSSSRQNYAMVFGSEALTQAEHTIKIRVTGNKNNASTGTYAIVDYVKVYTTATGGGAGSVNTLVAEEETAAQPMGYYPNPLRAGDVLHVDLPVVEGDVTLMDLGGVPLLNIPVTESSLTIPTDGLDKGMYLLQYRTSNGREVVKIMVQ